MKTFHSAIRVIAVAFLLCIFLSTAVHGQNPWTTAFKINRDFKIGDSKCYEVTDFYKIDHLLLGVRSEVTSQVYFRVVDTAQGGYWIMYNVHASSVKQHKDSAAYLSASLMNGIRLFLYVKGDFFHLDSATYARTQKRVAAKLASMTAGREFDKNTTQYIEKLKAELNEPEGLSSLLGPLSMFETYYLSAEYKKFRLTGDGMAATASDKPMFDGDISREWKRTSKDSTVELNFYFSAHPVHAAQYYKPIYEKLFAEAHVRTGRFTYPPEMRYFNDYTFKTQARVSFPSYLYKKTVSEYILRTVNRLEMKEIKTDETFIIIDVPKYVPAETKGSRLLRSI